MGEVVSDAIRLQGNDDGDFGQKLGVVASPEKTEEGNHGE